MMTAAADPTFARILVALDADEEARELLAAAADLAERMSAELQGLFVEDINLLRLAELPCSREVRFTGVAAAPDAEAIRRGVRAQAEAVRKTLAEIAEPRRLRWSFRVIRGQVAGELIGAAMAADLMVIGRGRRPYRRRQALVGSTVRRVAAEAAAAVLIPGVAVGRGPTAVVYDGTPEAARALDAAVRLADRSGVTIFDIRRDRSQGLDETSLRAAADRVALVACERAALADAINVRGPNLLVYGCACGTELAPATQALFESVHAPILLIRA